LTTVAGLFSTVLTPVLAVPVVLTVRLALLLLDGAAAVAAVVPELLEPPQALKDRERSTRMAGAWKRKVGGIG
jgi:hypothetical protein